MRTKEAGIMCFLAFCVPKAWDRAKMCSHDSSNLSTCNLDTSTQLGQARALCLVLSHVASDRRSHASHVYYLTQQHKLDYRVHLVTGHTKIDKLVLYRIAYTSSFLSKISPCFMTNIGNCLH